MPQDSGGGGNTLLAFIVGGLVVVVVVLGFLMFNGHGFGHGHFGWHHVEEPHH